MISTKAPQGVVAFEVQELTDDGWKCIHAGHPDKAWVRAQQYAHVEGRTLRLAWVPDGGGGFIDGGPLGKRERGRR